MALKAVAGTKEAKPKTRKKGRAPSQESLGREGIISAARALLKTRAPESITALDLANAAGVDQRLIRYYFGHKDSVLSVVLHEYIMEVKEQRAARRENHYSLKEKLHQKTSSIIDLFFKEPYLHDAITKRILFGKGPDNQEISDLQENLIRASFAEFEEIIRDGIRSGEFREVDAQFAFVAYIGACQNVVSGFPLFQVISNDKRPKKLIVSDYADFVTDFFYMSFANIGGPSTAS